MSALFRASFSISAFSVCSRPLSHFPKAHSPIPIVCFHGDQMINHKRVRVRTVQMVVKRELFFREIMVDYILKNSVDFEDNCFLLPLEGAIGNIPNINYLIFCSEVCTNNSCETPTKKRTLKHHLLDFKSHFNGPYIISLGRRDTTANSEKLEHDMIMIQ